MASPFPGMDPYLESPTHWSDFHIEMISALREAIGDRLPEPYFARVGELVMMISPEVERPRSAGPDVLVGRDSLGDTFAGGSGSVATLSPVTMTNIEILDPVTEPYIEIVRLPDRDVVTVIELFSPTNKYGEGRGFYNEKRQRLLRTKVNIVEVDLIRAGKRVQLAKPLPPDHYYCFVSPGHRRPDCDVYHWSVRDPLPTLPIPLLPPDPDILVSLAEPFAIAFKRGKYERFIDYSERPPAPSFDAESAEWIAQIGQVHGRGK